MSELENRTKDVAAEMILNGSKVYLDPKEIQIIAQFAFKNAVIADYTAKGRNPFFTTSARRNFAQSHTIPEGVQVWLASYRDPHGHSGFFLNRCDCQRPHESSEWL